VIESSAKFIPKGALLVAMYGATIGRVAKLGIDATSNQAVCHILPDESLADMQYMFYALQAQVPHWLGKGVGGAQPNISQEIIKNTVLPLPPLEEQRRIAAILDKASDIHTLAAEKARTCAASLYRSVLAQELDQPGMEWVQIGDVLEIARGGSPRPIQAYLTDDPDGINWIMIGDAGVGEKYITNTAKKIRAEGLSKTRLVKEGDLLLSNSMSFGRPYIMKTNGAIHDGWLVLRDAHATCNSDYLYHVLGSPTCFAQFARAAAGATVKNLNTFIVSSVEIPLPPLERQVEIAERLDAVELHIGRKFSSLAQIAEQLRSSLTSSLIQGFS
jgi:type I restriction enzyme S subunit